MKLGRFSKYCWFLLAYMVLVILWGAFVRATGSGAGCGSHWPTCNGEVIPRSPQMNTVIEFTHRLTSGLLGVLTLGLLVGAFKRFPKGAPVRGGAVAVFLLVLSEALIGAGIVKFEWVADNDSVARVITVAFHLGNTFLLLGALALTSWWSSGGGKFGFRGHGWVGRLLALMLIGTVLLGAGGAMTALGDTLVQNSGIRAEDSPVVAVLVGLRIYHPVSALLLGVLLAGVFWTGADSGWDARTRKLAWWAAIIYALQLVCGLVNVSLQAPVWLQMPHLLLADSFWISLVLLTASVLTEREQRGVERDVLEHVAQTG